jgi:hypothetical protein
MPIDLKKEKVFGLAVATRLLPRGRNDKPMHVSTLVRAILNKDEGERLEALRIGNKWVTSVEALQRWAERRTAARIGPPASRTGQDERDERVERRLDELGI